MAADLAAVDRSAASWSRTSPTSSARRSRRCAPCWRTSSTASPSRTPGPCGPALDQAERLGRPGRRPARPRPGGRRHGPAATGAVPVPGLLDDDVVAEARADRPGGDVRRPTSTPPDARGPRPTRPGSPALTNLLDNAVRHSPAGGVVAVTAAGLGARLAAGGHRRGAGHRPADRERVFERFWTLTGSRGRDRRHRPRPRDRPLGDRPPRRHASTSSTRSRQRRRPAPRRPARTSHRQHTHVPRSAQEPAMPTQSAVPAARSRPDGGRGRPTPVARRRCSAGSGPTPAFPGSVRVVLPASGSACWPGSCCRSAPLGLGTFLVLVAAGAACRRRQRHRATPFTLDLRCVARVLLWPRPVLSCATRPGSWSLCLLAGAAVLRRRADRAAAPLPAVRARPAWPGRSPGCAGLPWLGRALRAPSPGRASSAAVLRTVPISSVLGLLVFGLLFASADARLRGVGERGASPTCSARLVRAAGVPHRRGRRRRRSRRRTSP